MINVSVLLPDFHSSLHKNFSAFFDRRNQTFMTGRKNVNCTCWNEVLEMLMLSALHGPIIQISFKLGKIN